MARALDAGSCDAFTSRTSELRGKGTDPQQDRVGFKQVMSSLNVEAALANGLMAGAVHEKEKESWEGGEVRVGERQDTGITRRPEITLSYPSLRVSPKRGGEPLIVPWISPSSLPGSPSPVCIAARRS